MRHHQHHSTTPPHLWLHHSKVNRRHHHQQHQTAKQRPTQTKTPMQNQKLVLLSMQMPVQKLPPMQREKQIKANKTYEIYCYHCSNMLGGGLDHVFIAAFCLSSFGRFCRSSDHHGFGVIYILVGVRAGTDINVCVCVCVVVTSWMHSLWFISVSFGRE